MSAYNKKMSTSDRVLDAIDTLSPQYLAKMAINKCVALIAY